ncbi:hypothetical protein EC991_010764 [Linnemannia zychae]|nr:hypothetical protein EC991_010764 [Linnemannia zychae]
MPNMLLRRVVDIACKRHHDRHPESYILRQGDNDLNLSGTIHSNGIVSGSQLDLVKRFRGTSTSSHFRIALQLGVTAKDSILLAASTSLRKALLVLEQATEGHYKSVKCTSPLLPSTVNNNNTFAIRRSLSRSRRASPKFAPFQRSFKSSTIALSASFESGTGVVRVLMPHMNAGLDRYDHLMSDYDDNDDVNMNQSSGIWDNASQLSSSSPPLHPAAQLSSSPVLNTFSPINNNNTLAPPTEPSFVLPASIAQPNNDKPLSGNVSIPTPYAMPVPSLTARTGYMGSVCRDGHLPSSGSGGGGNGSDGETNRQTPTQDISAAMIEANQEIRQRLEQQTQEALTDRVRCLSKNSDSSSDKDRFLRSMHVDGSNPTKKNQQDDIVRQIALRVSRMLKEAEERGETALDYQTLIAQEIAKEQRGGMLAL